DFISLHIHICAAEGTDRIYDKQRFFIIIVNDISQFRQRMQNRRGSLACLSKYCSNIIESVKIFFKSFWISRFSPFHIIDMNIKVIASGNIGKLAAEYAADN